MKKKIEYEQVDSALPMPIEQMLTVPVSIVCAASDAHVPVQEPSAPTPDGSAPPWVAGIVIRYPLSQAQARELMERTNSLPYVELGPGYAKITRLGIVEPPPSWDTDLNPWTALLDDDTVRNWHRNPMVWRIAGAREVEQNRVRIEQHGLDLPRAINICCRYGLFPLPDWLSSAYQRAYEKVTKFEVATLDEAFGRNRMTMRNRETRARHLQLLPEFCRSTVAILRNEPGLSQRNLFEAVAIELGIGLDLVEIIYRLARANSFPNVRDVRKFLRSGRRL